MVPKVFEKYSVMSSRCRHPYYKENLFEENEEKKIILKQIKENEILMNLTIEKQTSSSTCTSIRL